jgi:predicted nucleotidyltransferase
MNPARLAALARKHGIVLLMQFGSTVTGLEHAQSDLDLAVLLERVPTSWEAQADLIADLQALEPDREVDVAIVNGADPLFLKQITDSARLLHGTPERFHALKLYAFRRHQDHRRFFQMERAYVDRMIAALGR